MIKSGTHKDSAWFAKQRINFAEAYAAADLPSFKYGITIFSKPPANLLNADNSYVLRGQEINQVVDGVKLISFSIALRELELEQLLKNYWMRSTRGLGNGKLLALHGTHLESGLLVYVTSGYRSKAPIFISKDLFSGLRFTHVLVIAEHESAVTIVDQTISDSPKLRSHVIEIFAQSNSAIEYISTAKLEAGCAVFVQKVATAGEHATMVWRDYLVGSGFVKSSSDTLLEGRGSSVADIAGFTGSSSALDMERNVVHQAPQSKSDIVARGVLFGNTKAIWRGKVAVRPNASDSIAYQRADSLLASEAAEVDTIPVLEVENDRVQARHGASTRRINRDHLFYLKSRGLSEEEATQTLIAGFLKPVMHEYVHIS